MDTQSPPGNEKPAGDYVAQILEREGIPVQVFALEAHRPNVVARLRGNGSKRPLLIMAHTDTVNVDPAKWRHPPFSAARDGGHIYGRGTVDDKDSVTAGLMTMLMLKRNLVSLDRDVIFLAEAGEESATTVGIEFMVNEHFDSIDAEYCLAEGGSATRVEGEMRYVGVQAAEKFPKGIDLIAHGVAGHGSVPLESNAIARLARDHRRHGVAASRRAERHDARLFRAACRDPGGSRARAPLSRSPELQSPSRRGGRRMVARQYSDASVDAADLGFAEHRARRLSQQRDSIRSPRDAGRAHAPRRRPRRVPRRDRARHRRRAGRRRLQRLRHASARHDVTRRRRDVRRDRTRGTGALRRPRATNDGHGRNRHGVLA